MICAARQFLRSVLSTAVVGEADAVSHGGPDWVLWGKIVTRVCISTSHLFRGLLQTLPSGVSIVIIINWLLYPIFSQEKALLDAGHD